MKVKKHTLKDLRALLTGPGDTVIEILPDGEVNVLDTDPYIDKAFNAGLERAARWHKMMAQRERKDGTRQGANEHDRDAKALRELKRK